MSDNPGIEQRIVEAMRHELRLPSTYGREDRYNLGWNDAVVKMIDVLRATFAEQTKVSLEECEERALEVLSVGIDNLQATTRNVTKAILNHLRIDYADSDR